MGVSGCKGWLTLFFFVVVALVCLSALSTMSSTDVVPAMMEQWSSVWLFLPTTLLYTGLSGRRGECHSLRKASVPISPGSGFHLKKLRLWSSLSAKRFIRTGPYFVLISVKMIGPKLQFLQSSYSHDSVSAIVLCTPGRNSAVRWMCRCRQNSHGSFMAWISW